MRQPILLHVGYHKTATSWMQRLLFTEAHGYHAIANHQDMFDHVVKPLGTRFNPEPIRKLIAERMARVGTDATPIISSEILSGHPFLGGREADVYAERLARILPDARILISIRNQMRILPSVYMQYVRRGGTMPYDVFFEGQNEIAYFGFNTEHYEYDIFVSLYRRLFGADRVHVVTQEALQRDMNEAARDIAKFSGNSRFTELVPEAHRVDAASYPEYAACVLRRINHVQRSTLNPCPIISLGETPRGLFRLAGYGFRLPVVKSMVTNKKPISTYVARRFAGVFSASNDRLAALMSFQLDLDGYQSESKP